MIPELVLVDCPRLRPSDLGLYGVIYGIKHRKSGLMYVGQTVQALGKRLRQHLSQAVCVRLHRALAKHGIAEFEVFILDVAHSKGDLDVLEAFWIQLLNVQDPSIGYNLRGGGSFGTHTEQSRKKMSDKVRQALERPEYREALRRRPPTDLSPESRARISQALKGKPLSDEHKSVLSERRSMLWQDPVVAGRMLAAQNEGKARPESRAAAAEKSRLAWQDPVKRQNMLDAQNAARARKKQAKSA